MLRLYFEISFKSASRTHTSLLSLTYTPSPSPVLSVNKGPLTWYTQRENAFARQANGIPLTGKSRAAAHCRNADMNRGLWHAADSHKAASLLGPLLKRAEPTAAAPPPADCGHCDRTRNTTLQEPVAALRGEGGTSNSYVNERRSAHELAVYVISTLLFGGFVFIISSPSTRLYGSHTATK